MAAVPPSNSDGVVDGARRRTYASVTQSTSVPYFNSSSPSLVFDKSDIHSIGSFEVRDNRRILVFSSEETVRLAEPLKFHSCWKIFPWNSPNFDD